MSAHRPRTITLTALIVVGLGINLTPALAQDKIGINFWRNYDPVAPSLTSTDVAGVISQSNWNSVGTTLPDAGSPRTNVGVSLFANNGASSGATLDFTAGKIDILPVDQVPSAPTDSNKKMMYDYLDTRTTNGVTYKPSVTIKNLTFAKYDIYVYYDAGTGNNGSNPHNQTAKYTLKAGALSSVLFGNDHDTFQGTYKQGQSTTYDPNHVSDTGNYLVFRDVSGSSFTLSATGIGSDGKDNGAAAPINGIQIVASSPVPEPAFYQMGSLAILGGLGMFRMRRRK